MGADAYTDRIVVGGVPAGTVTVLPAADGVQERSLTLETSPGQRV